MENTLVKVRMWNWVITAACVAVGVGIWTAFGRRLPPEIPMLYTRPWGEEQLVKPFWLMFLPIMAGGVGSIMGWAAGRLKQELPLTIMILGTSMVFELVIILGMLRIVLSIL